MTGPFASPPGQSAGLGLPLARTAGIIVPPAAAMAVGMGVGRFVYTPILPLMTARAGLSPQGGATIATANYAGYLAGAMAGVALPALLRSRAAYRSSLIVVVATLALMPVLAGDAGWAALRFVAGCASALVFMVAASALLTGLRARGEHLVGHGFGGVGAGIAVSGVLVLVLRHNTWQDSWWSASRRGAGFRGAVRRHVPGRRHRGPGHRRSPGHAARRGHPDHRLQRRPDRRAGAGHAVASPQLPASAGAAIVAAAAVAALVLRHRFPHHLGPVPRRVLAAR
jgi:Uncharacterised MFS-type transporter YbfB